jgi:hypothetical protein
LNAPPQPFGAIELPYRWAGTEGTVGVEIRVNDDPAALGCSELARGYPYMRATIEPPAKGYADALGWVQLLDSSLREGGFLLDYFEPLGPVPHPFGFYGFAPTFFDAPHSDEDDWDFLAHSFLCGLGGEILDQERDVRAVLGFSWGFSKRGEVFEYLGPEPLGPDAWEAHLEYLTGAYPDWTFTPAFHQTPLGP